MRREPGLERGGAIGLALAVDAAKCVERADEDEQVGDGDAEHHPVDEVEGPHVGGGGGVRWSGDMLLLLRACVCVYLCAGVAQGGSRRACVRRNRGRWRGQVQKSDGGM